MKSALLLPALLVCLGPPVHPVGLTDYYVSPSGDDVAGDGSQGNPWRTITRALLATNTGDTVLVEPGRYDDTTGEIFPIFVDDDVTIAGTDPADKPVVETSADEAVFKMGRGGPGLDKAHLRDLELHAPGQAEPVLYVAGKPVSVRGSTIVAGGRGIHAASPTTLASSIFIESNQILGPQFHSYAGVFFGGVSSPSRVVIRKNEIVSMGHGLFFQLVPQYAELEITDNRLEDCEGEGIRIRRWPYVAETQLLLEGNTIVGAGGNGVYVHCRGTEGVWVQIEGTIRFNTITGSGSDGLSIFLSAYAEYFGPGRVNMACPIYGNTIRANQRDGVDYEAYTYYGHPLNDVLDPEMGGGRLGLPAGGNTIDPNGRYDLRARACCAGPELEPVFGAVGNWWGTTDPVEIEDRVNHHPENNGNLLVDYSGPLSDSLEVTVRPRRLVAGRAETISVEVGEGGLFVPYAGETPIQVTLAGVPVEGVEVAPGGRSLSFEAPPVSLLGPVNLVVTNPGGQTGAAVVIVKPGSPVFGDGPLPAR